MAKVTGNTPDWVLRDARCSWTSATTNVLQQAQEDAQPTGKDHPGLTTQSAIAGLELRPTGACCDDEHGLNRSK
jgi:hypothetical protein